MNLNRRTHYLIRSARDALSNKQLPTELYSDIVLVTAMNASLVRKVYCAGVSHGSSTTLHGDLHI